MNSASESALKIEKLLAERHGRECCVLFSRGAAALYCLFSHLAETRGSSVIMPSLLCMSPAFAASYAGLETHFAEVRESDFQIDASDVVQLMSSHFDVAAVLVPHLYGSPADIEAIIDAARAHDIPVIEDAAQAQGMTIDGRLAGSLGDVSLLSFGHTKIIDAGGGAALLFDDPSLERPLRNLAAGLPGRSSRFDSLANAYRETYYALAPLFRRDLEMGRLYAGFPAVFRELYVYGGGVAESTLDRIRAGLEGLDNAIERRRELAALYRRSLEDSRIHHPPSRAGDVPWRYSFTVDVPDPARLADDVRSEGVNLSNWYPPLHRMMNAGSRVLPVADYVGQHIFNLWTQPDTPDADAVRAADVVMRKVTEYDR